MKLELAMRLAKAGFRIMHDSDQHEVLAIRGGQVEGAMGELERDALYRFHCLGAEARAQALRLTSNREQFILREYVTQQVFAAATNLDEVEAAIERRKADQSARVHHLRHLAAGHTWEGEHRGGWVDHAARMRLEERGQDTGRPIYCCARISCMRAAVPGLAYCELHGAPASGGLGLLA